MRCMREGKQMWKEGSDKRGGIRCTNQVQPSPPPHLSQPSHYTKAQHTKKVVHFQQCLAETPEMKLNEHIHKENNQWYSNS